MILCGFAAIVGVLTTRQIHEDFHNEVAASADKLEQDAQLRMVVTNGRVELRPTRNSTDLDDFAASSNAAIRVITEDDLIGFRPRTRPTSASPSPRTSSSTAGASRRAPRRRHPGGTAGGSSTRARSPRCEDTAARVKVFLAFGVLGGALLALLAGLATARRAMEPITELTEAAREIERTRDPSLKVPHPDADDEVAELARTLDAMLAALDERANGDRERAGPPARVRRRRLARAAHAADLACSPTSSCSRRSSRASSAEAAASALRSSRRMRRLVADLLLLARADAGRQAPHRPSTCREVVTDAAAELEPRGRRPRDLGRRAAPALRSRARATSSTASSLNLMENALRHTDPGTAVEATVERAQRRGRARRRGRRARHPAGAAREGVRALLPRRRRPQRLVGPRALDRARRGRVAPRHRRARARRWTGAAPASWCGSRRLTPQVDALTGCRSSEERHV